MNKNNFMKAMSMIDEELLHEADTPYTQEETETTSQGTYSENKTPDSVSGVDVYHGFLWKKFLAVAATFVLAAGAVGGGAYYYSQLKEKNNIINDSSMVEKDTEHDPVIQTSTKTKTTTTQTTTTQTTTNKHIISTQTFADTETTVQDTTPLSNIVRFEPIKLPDNIRSISNFERTADGFSGIAYYGEQGNMDMAYLHFSEDLQTVEMSVLTPPGDESVYYFSYRGSAFEEGGIWVIVSKDRKDQNENEKPQYLLCHYAEDGTLLSVIPANDLQNSGNYLSHVNCVGDMLYATMSDGRFVQIDKETGEISVITDLGREYIDRSNYFNDKFLCFDRDDKPVLLQVKKYTVPDYSRIEEVVVSEFDLASGSCGQTLYNIGEGLGELNQIRFLKGFGEYRFFINTYSEFIGIKDDGTQEVLIDINASDLEAQIMNPDDQAVPYTNNLFDINIIPVDDTHFLGLYMHYPECRTEAFRFTRKRESELN
jgi:hypothetical protein